MHEKLLEQLTALFMEGKHSEIIEKINKIPQDQWGYELTNHLGRAYNNVSKYNEALEVLYKVADQGAINALWNYRVGFAYYYSDEEDKALQYFQASADLGDKDAGEFVQMIEPGSSQDNLATKEVEVSANQLEIQGKMLKQSTAEFEQGLNDLQKEFPFDYWHKTLLGEYEMEQYTLENCNKAEVIMSDLITDLIKIGLHADEQVKLEYFEKATVAYNTLNEATDHALIETGERETLCELIDKIGVVCGLIPVKFGGGDGIASEWRDW